MISIIICSINPERCKKTLDNISKTIGIEYETIIFDNRIKKFGICKVYNLCAEKAIFPYLCFIHEDVFIETVEWGKHIIEFIEETPECGVVGVAGGLQVTRNFTSWWSSDKIINVHYGYNGGNNKYLKLNYNNHDYVNPNNYNYAQVVCIDGLMQCVRKTIWNEIRFDDNNYSGFHFYDVDFSFSVSQKYKNYVLLDIDIYHDSSGSFNESYVKNMFLFQKKWRKKLPYYLEEKNIYIKTICELRDVEALLIDNRNIHNIIFNLIHIVKNNTFVFNILIFFYIPIKIALRLLYKLYKRL